MGILTIEEGKLKLLEKRIRTDLDLRDQTQSDWVRATLDLSAAFAEAREYFHDNIGFGRWCDECGFDISKDDRAALVAFGREMDRAREILGKTERRSIQHIYKREFRVRHVTNTRKAKPDAGLSTTPAMQKALDAYDEFIAAGIEPTYEQLCEKSGASATAVRRALERRRTEEQIARQEADISGLPKTSQEKIAAAIAKIQKRMDFEYEERVRQGVQRFIAEYTMPMYAEKLKLADRIIAGKKPFSIEEYRKLLAALHPDGSSIERRTEMFRLVKEREAMLRPPEKDKPLSGNLPKTIEELLARRRTR